MKIVIMIWIGLLIITALYFPISELIEIYQSQKKSKEYKPKYDAWHKKTFGKKDEEDDKITEAIETKEDLKCVGYFLLVAVIVGIGGKALQWIFIVGDSLKW